MPAAAQYGPLANEMPKSDKQSLGAFNAEA
jgi:hypothetical protein